MQEIRTDKPSNVLLIVLDQWRADALGAANGLPVKTPHLDALVADGVLFEQHFSQSAPCAPARASLLTGMYQHNHGVKRNGTPLSARFTNLALEMRKVGYTPALFGYTDTTLDPRGRDARDPALRTYEGVLPGFDPELILTAEALPWINHLHEQGYAFASNANAAYSPATRAAGEPPTRAPAQYSAEHSVSAVLTDALLGYISMRRDRPWFAHAAYIKPHPPFIASAPYHRMYSPHEIPPVRRMDTVNAEAGSHPLVNACLNTSMTSSFWVDGQGLVKDMSDADMEQLRATYCGMVTEVDMEVGRVVGQLKEWGLYDNTLILVTSDHGEMLGDHWMLGKESPFEQAYKVPLIVRDPRAQADVSRGTRVQHFSEAVDVMPTILDWVNSPIPRQCDGHSLMGWLHGRDVSQWRDAAHWEYDFRNAWRPGPEAKLGVPMDSCALTALRTQEHLYIHCATLPPLLYDLRADPGCLNNLAGDPAHAQTMLDCAQRLLSWHIEKSARELTGMSASPDGLVVRDAVAAQLPQS